MTDRQADRWTNQQSHALVYATLPLAYCPGLLLPFQTKYLVEKVLEQENLRLYNRVSVVTMPVYSVAMVTNCISMFVLLQCPTVARAQLEANQ